MKVDYHNMPLGCSKRKFALNYMLNRVRTWNIIHIRYRRKHVQYYGFVRIQHGTRFESQGISMGDNVQFGPNCKIMSPVEFHSHILLAGNVCFVGKNNHTFNVPGQTIWNSEKGVDKKTVVQDDVWIGHGAVVLAGVTIGRGAVVAAASVVTKDIPPCEVWGGNPARKIRDRFLSEDEKSQHLKYLDSFI